jgi:kynurenine formamidase
VLFELSHAFEDAMPHHPMVPPFQHLFARRLGDVVRPGGVSVASDVLVAPLHVGTHIDAFSHVADAQQLARERAGGIAVERPAGETLAPLITRGVVLDCRAAVDGGTHEIGPQVLADVADRSGALPGVGDVALVATGWERHWGDPEAYAGARADAPGLSVDGARWLADRGVVAVGADTPALEPASTRLGVHRLLLEERRVLIIENLCLAPLLDAGERDVLFLALPLRIVGATASPLRCVAVTGEGVAAARAVLRAAVED